MRDILLILFLFALSPSISGQQTLPLKIGNENIKPLTKLVDTSLQANLEEEMLSNEVWSHLISQKSS